MKLHVTVAEISRTKFSIAKIVHVPVSCVKKFFVKVLVSINISSYEIFLLSTSILVLKNDQRLKARSKGVFLSLIY